MKKLERWINNIRLQPKMLIIYVMIGFLPVFILSALFYSQIRNTLLEKDTANLQTFLYEGTISMDNQLVIYDNLTNYISYNQTIGQVICSEYDSTYKKYEQIVGVLDPMLASLKYFHDDLKQVTIYMENVDVPHDTTLVPLADIEKMSWFAKANNSSKTEWFISNNLKEAFSARKMPTVDSYGLTGILYISVDYDALFASFEHTLRSNYGVYIVDELGKVVFATKHFEEPYQEYELTLDEMLIEKKLQEEKKANYTIVKEHSAYTGWDVYLYMPNSFVLSSMEPLIHASVILVITCIIISVLMVYFTSHFITGRIKLLTNKMEEVESGNLEVTVFSEEKDEIGDLIRGFGNMITQIRTLISEVYESKIKQKAYEMKALQAQINPHFLYNSLSLINWKAIEAGKEDISQITLALSTFYRTSLNKGKNTLRIREEIENVKSYLRIQSVMHDDEFKLVYEIDDNILEYETLNLILQPIVENSIEHGLEMMEEGGGVLTIRGYLENDCVILQVEDNGLGMDEESVKTILTVHSKGYGMRNVNERLRLFYGEDYTMKIESKLGEGTKVSIKIPIEKTYS